MYTLYQNIKSFFEQPWPAGLLILLASLFISKIIGLLLCRFFSVMAQKTKTELDNKIIVKIEKPLFWSLFFYGAHLAFVRFQLTESTYFILFGLMKTITVFLWTLAIFQVGRLFLKALTKKADAHSILQKRTLPLFSMTLKIVSFGMAIYFIFLAWNIDVTAWLASAGIIGIAVGFAAKDTLANLFAGIFIIADAPYRIGDFIVLEDGVRGRVTQIGMRSTRVLTLDDVEVTIPNAVIGSTKIMNEAGGPGMKQRIAVPVSAAYGVDIDVVREVLLGCSKDIDGVSSFPSATTRFESFGASGLDFSLLVWIDRPAMRDIVLDILHERVYKAFHEAGLEIPYNKHDLYIKEYPSKAAVHLPQQQSP